MSEVRSVPLGFPRDCNLVVHRMEFTTPLRKALRNSIEVDIKLSYLQGCKCFILILKTLKSKRIELN